MSYHFKPIVSETQHGFHPRISVSTNLNTFTVVVAIVHCRGKVDANHVDIPKAFDLMDRDILPYKQRSHGLSHGLSDFSEVQSVLLSIYHGCPVASLLPLLLLSVLLLSSGVSEVPILDLCSLIFLIMTWNVTYSIPICSSAQTTSNCLSPSLLPPTAHSCSLMQIMAPSGV